MKVSLFNKFQPWEDGNYLAYNARSGAVALMTSENYALYLKMAEKMNSGTEADFTSEETALLKQLNHGTFAFPGDYDELESLRFKHYQARYDRRVLGISITPTMACNMACRYCYEDNKKGRMSPKVVAEVIDFVKERAVETNLLEVTWFGGEPLLAMDIIQDLSKAFFEIQKEHKFRYSSIIITNGYLLTQKNVDILSEMKVGMAQITVDGPASHHDINRPLKNGGPTFAAIVGNIKYASEKMNISLRVNTDKNTTPEIVQELLNELELAGLRESVAVNYGHIEATSDACANIAESCFDTFEFSKAEVQYYGLLFKKGFSVGKLPMPNEVACMCQSVNSYLIDHEGRIFNCFGNIGDPSKAVGTLKDGVDYNHKNYTSLFKFDPFANESCRSCEVLPVCLGGCPAKRINPNFAEAESCAPWKHNLRPMLEIIARSVQQQTQTAERS